MAAVFVSRIVAPGGPAFFFFFFLRLFVRSVEVMASLAGGAGTESRGRYFLSFTLKNLLLHAVSLVPARSKRVTAGAKDAKREGDGT